MATTHPFVSNEFKLLHAYLFVQFEEGNNYYKMNFLYLMVLGKFEGHYLKTDFLTYLQDDLYSLRHLVSSYELIPSYRSAIAYLKTEINKSLCF